MINFFYCFIFSSDGRDVLKTALTEAGNKDEDSRTTITDDKQVETSTMTASDTNNRSAAAAGDEAAERSASPAADEVSASTSARYVYTHSHQLPLVMFTRVYV